MSCNVNQPAAPGQQACDMPLRVAKAYSRDKSATT
jgi:hypothetical protein